jgi:L-fuconolactonase
MTDSLAIVDSHVHLWNPEQLRYSWLDDLPFLNRPLLPADLTTASASSHVDKLIFVESGCDPSKNLAEADWVVDLAKTESKLKGIIAHAPLERGPAVRTELESLARHPLVKGVRRNFQSETAEFFQRHELLEGLQLLPKFVFTFDICVRAEQLPAVNELVRSLPDVTFILDHFGKPSVREKHFASWARDLRTLSESPNIVCKISGLATEADWTAWQPADLAPYFDHALACFGWSRVLFGSDWPVATLATTYGRWVETVLKLIPRATPLERMQLFQTNAERIYRV